MSHINLYDLAFLGVIFTGMTFALLLWFTQRVNQAANKFLALATVVMVLCVARILSIDIRIGNLNFQGRYWPFQFSLAFGPLMYFYVLKLSDPGHKFNRKALLHFAPLLFEQLLWLSPVKLMPLFQLLAFISVTVYLYLSQRSIRDFYRRLKFNGGDRYRYQLRWLHRLITGFALLWLLWIPVAAWDHFYHVQSGVNAGYLLYLVLVALTIRIAAEAYLRPEIETSASLPTVLKPSLPTELKQKGAWLKKMVRENRYYQDPELSLRSLAEKLELHPNDLSRIINTVLKKSFNDFINEYRVEEVAWRMQDATYDHITLQGIAYESGFNSKTTFHRIFKEMTGKSPAEYKIDHKNELPSYNLEPRARFAAVISYQQTVPKWMDTKLNRNVMIKNYLKTAWRNLVRSKTTSMISMAGLAVGIGCFLLLATYLVNELRYDRFNVNADRMVRMIHGYRSSGDHEDNISANTPTAPVPVFKQTFSEVEDGVRIINYSNFRPATVQYGDKLFKEKNLLLADDSFFKIFTFKFLEGNPSTALSQTSSIVITTSTAKKYFGDADPMGKVLKLDNVNNMLVTGVIEDVPQYSQVKFDMLGNYAIMPRSKTRIWDSANDYSYLLLKPGANAQNVQQKMNDYVANLFKDDKSGAKEWFILEPLTRVHLYSTAKNSLEPYGNIKYVYILAVVAVILLLLACINFLNLVTAKSIERAHEIGVRKVMGAVRGQLFVQFITEAGIITFLSLLAGVLLAALSFSWFSDFTGNKLGFQTWNTSLLLSALVVLFVAVTLVAGTYPSLYLSAFNPVTSLKGKSTSGSGSSVLRKSLVVFQFAVSVFFIISTIIAGRQLQYIQQMDTGINRSQVMVIDIGGMPFKKIQAFKSELLQQRGVKNVSASYDSPVDVHGGYTIDSAEGKTAKLELSVTAIPVEKDFAPTLGIKLIAGNNFTQGDEERVLNPDPQKHVFSFIINESTAKALNWKPTEAIGKRINLNGRKGEIRAVARDFNFASLHKEITPIVIFPEYYYFGKLLIKTSDINVANTVDMVKNKWKSFYPGMPFEFHFLDEEYEKMYQTEQRTGGILTVFTLITVFISCLGLFGLAVFSTKQRVKEVGIRKVLGASVFNIVGLISSDFLKLVFFSVIIASPLAYYAMNKWLQDFVYRTNIQWWAFVLAGGLAVFVAFLTVSYQSVKAAMSNPVKSLRSE